MVMTINARVLVCGYLFGTVVYLCSDGAVAVQLDGETTVHEWHPSQVEVTGSMA